MYEDRFYKVMQRTDGKTITYTRASTTLSITALVLPTVEYDTSDGVLVQEKTMQFQIALANLGTLIEPQIGDKITYLNRVYTVCHPIYEVIDSNYTYAKIYATETGR